MNLISLKKITFKQSLLWGIITETAECIFFFLGQFILIHLIVKKYDLEKNIIIRIIISFLMCLNLSEDGIGFISIFYLTKALKKNNKQKINEIVWTVTDEYKKIIKSLLKIFLICLCVFVIFSKFFLTASEVKIWELLIIVPALLINDLFTSYFLGGEQGLLTANKQNYLRKLINFFAEIIIYGYMFLFLIISIKVPFFIIFLIYYFVIPLKFYLFKKITKINFPWLKPRFNFDKNKIIPQTDNYFYFSLPEKIKDNLGIVFIVLFLGLSVATKYNIHFFFAFFSYRIANILVKHLSVAFIGEKTTKKDSLFSRFNCRKYQNLELFTYIIASFIFINQFFISRDEPLWTSLIYPDKLRGVEFNFQILAILLTLNSITKIVNIPAKIAINASQKYYRNRQTNIQILWLVVVLNFILNGILFLVFRETILILYIILLLDILTSIVKVIKDNFYVKNNLILDYRNYYSRINLSCFIFIIFFVLILDFFLKISLYKHFFLNFIYLVVISFIFVYFVFTAFNFQQLSEMFSIFTKFKKKNATIQN